MSNSATRVTTVSVTGRVQPDGHRIRYRNDYNEVKKFDILDCIRDYAGKKVSLDITISQDDMLNY